MGPQPVPDRTVGRRPGHTQHHRPGGRLGQGTEEGEGPRLRADGLPHQLTSCPWCGSKMEAGRDISVDTTLRRTFITCPDAYECPFGASAFGLPADEQGLPVLVVDEEIYRLPPSLVIATVDKFAQLPWKGDTQALFGQVSRRCTRHGYVTPSAVDADWESSSHPAANHHPAASTVDAPGYARRI